MATAKPKFGLTLPNRGVVIGATTVTEMFEMAEWADGSAAWDSVWVGDSIFAKPRLDLIEVFASPDGPGRVPDIARAPVPKLANGIDRHRLESLHSPSYRPPQTQP